MSTEAVVQNGTEIAPPAYVALVAKFRMLAKHAAENIVRLAQTLVEADDKLSKHELRQFCTEVGLKHEGSTYRKLMRIGQEVSRFEPFVERMPNNWTTVYKLATLEKDKFDQVANDNRFTPMMTAKDVEMIISGGSKGVDHKRDVVIDLTGLGEHVKVEVYRTVKSLEQQFKFKLTVREEIKTLANNCVVAT